MKRRGINNRCSNGINKKHPSPPYSPSASVLNDGKGGEGFTLERWEKEIVKGSQWSSENNEDDGGVSCGEPGEGKACVFRLAPAATTTASLSGRKRVRLQEKVLEDYNVVDLAVVPRRLRTALKNSTQRINKRSTESASLLLPESKRKQLLNSNRTQLPLVNGASRFKQSMPLEPSTKDEREVAEILSELVSTILARNPTIEDTGVSIEISEVKATSTSLPEASNEWGAKILLPCMGTEATKPSSCIVESPEETVKSMPFVMEQPMQFHALPAHTPEIGLCPIGSASGEQEPQSTKKKYDDGVHYVSQEETTLDDQHDLPSSDQEHSTISSSKAALCTDSVIGAGKPSSTVNGLPTEKLPLVADTKLPRKRCATHVHICHAIQNYENSVQSSDAAIESGNGPISMTSAGANGSVVMESNIHEARIEMLEEGRLQQAQQQVCDITSLSTTGGTDGASSGVKPSGEFRGPCLHPQLSHHALVPFAFSHDRYPDQPATVATQQVQLQLPHYIANLFYEQNIVTTKQQQPQAAAQMWQARVAHYRPQVGILKWPNGKQPNRPDDTLQQQQPLPEGQAQLQLLFSGRQT